MKAELIDQMGDDLTVVNAARVSFDKESTWEIVKGTYYQDEGPDIELSSTDKKLISYLAKHGHFTPFTHCMITLRETVPIFVARQRFKHTVGFSYNEVSRRYVDDAPEFYFPNEWRGKPVNAKQGSSEEIIDVLEIDEHLIWDDPTTPKLTVDTSEMYDALIEHAESLYNLMIKNGVAPEQARMVLPQSMYTSYYVTGSLSAFARAYKLRSESHAQKEIQDLAKQWDAIIRPLYSVSWSALVDE